MMQAGHFWQIAHMQQAGSLIARPSAGQQTPLLCASTFVRQARIPVPHAQILQRPALQYASCHECLMNALSRLRVYLFLRNSPMHKAMTALRLPPMFWPMLSEQLLRQLHFMHPRPRIALVT